LLAIARRRAAESDVPVELLLGSATAIPLADDTVDKVVMTWTLCSIPDPLAAFRTMSYMYQECACHAHPRSYFLSEEFLNHK
jgi:ubiquinone/menaquinone biosynthesis C-methylase UbiE